jgi:hypothetical protein
MLEQRQWDSRPMGHNLWLQMFEVHLPDSHAGNMTPLLDTTMRDSLHAWAAHRHHRNSNRFRIVPVLSHIKTMH